MGKSETMRSSMNLALRGLESETNASGTPSCDQAVAAATTAGVVTKSSSNQHSSVVLDSHAPPEGGASPATWVHGALPRDDIGPCRGEEGLVQGAPCRC